MPSGIVFLQSSFQPRSWRCGALKALRAVGKGCPVCPAGKGCEARGGCAWPGTQQSLYTLDWHSWSICHFVSVLCLRECFLWDWLSSAVGFIAGPCVWNVLCSEINHLWKHRGSTRWPRLSGAWHYVSPTDIKYCTILLGGLSGISLGWNLTSGSSSLNYGLRAGTRSCDLWYGKQKKLLYCGTAEKISVKGERKGEK